MNKAFMQDFPFWQHCDYTRPEQPLLSIMYPTRGRSEILKRVIDRFQDTIGKQIPIEICIKIDTDDVETIKAIQEVDYKNVRFLISDREKGYESMGKYWNDLVNISNGIYLMLWNDDAWLDTPGNLAEILLSRNKDLPCIIRSEARGEVCYFRCIHWSIWDRIRDMHGYRGDRHIFEGVIYVDLYFMDHVRHSIRGHVSPEEYDLLEFEATATYEYSHWEHDRVVGSHNNYNESKEVAELIEKVGYEKGWLWVEKDKENIRQNNPQLFYHPGGRRIHDEGGMLDLVFLNWEQYKQLPISDRLKVLERRKTYIRKYQSIICDLKELLN